MRPLAKQALQPLAQLWQDVLGLVFPRLCAACNTLLLDSEREICTHCLVSLPGIGRALHPADTGLRHRLGQAHLAGAAALCLYEGVVPDLVHHLKYHERPKLGERLGRELGRRLAAQPGLPPDLVLVPVPLHPRKFRQRGYNQAEWIARGIASQHAGWQVRPELLRRTRHTVSQTGKDRQDRQSNVAGVFAAGTTVPARIAVVDDVITTGATILSAAAALQAAGAQEVYLFSLAEVPDG